MTINDDSNEGRIDDEDDGDYENEDNQTVSVVVSMPGTKGSVSNPIWISDPVAHIFFVKIKSLLSQTFLKNYIFSSIKNYFSKMEC